MTMAMDYGLRSPIPASYGSGEELIKVFSVNTSVAVLEISNVLNTEVEVGVITYDASGTQTPTIPGTIHT